MTEYPVIASGRNNVAIDDITTEYTALLNLMISLDTETVIKTIICRGVLPEPAQQTNINATNSQMQAAIAAAIIANPTVDIIYVPTDSWLPIDRPDLTHPSVVGYRDDIYPKEVIVVAGIISPPPVYELTGVTYDKLGEILPSCQVSLFKHSGSGVYVYVTTVVSDGVTGAFTFGGLDNEDPDYMITFHLDGTPNVFDVSDNNLTPVVV